MHLAFSEQDEQFRAEVALWMQDNLSGQFEQLRFRGGPGDEHMFTHERKQWEQRLADGKWTGLAWPKEYGGRAASIEQQVIFYEEYARHGGPGRVGHIGEGLLAPTLITFATQEQKARYLPPILRGEELWCQGYSEPNAGSDLANVQTRAHYDKGLGKWLLSGQKVWTSLAHDADWCFVLARCQADSVRHQGLGFFLVNMHQPNIDVRGIVQLTGSSEFNEVFLDCAVAQDIVGAPGEGWKIAMALLGFERGVSTLGQQMAFQNELDAIVDMAKTNGAAQDPTIRQRIATAHIGLRLMRFNALRMLSDSGELNYSALVYKLHWASWHRNLGDLAMDVMGDQANIVADENYTLTRLQSMFLFSRSDTIYGGSNQIQRNIIAERGLGMPKEKKWY